MKAVGCVLVFAWAFVGVMYVGLTAETSDASRMRVPPHAFSPHMADPHQRLRQHLQREIRRPEESENIRPEEREQRIQCRQRQLRHIDDVWRHHQEMLMRMREHERERFDRLGPRREITPPKKCGVVQGDLKRRKQESDRIRIRNGQEMLRQLAVRRERYGRDVERKSYWMEFEPLGLFVGIVVLVVGMCIVYSGWMGVKAYVVYRKTAAAYEDKHGGLHSCAVCGQTGLPTHAIYHSVFRQTDIRLREYDIDRCGFAVQTCDRCLWLNRL